MVTKGGNIIYPDRQLMLFADDVLRREPGAQIIYDVKCTRNLAPWIREHGGKPLMWKTGHSLIKAKLKETGAPLAGEMSGHMFFKERWYGFDDGLYAGARLLEILSRARRSERAARGPARLDQHAGTQPRSGRRASRTLSSRVAQDGDVRPRAKESSPSTACASNTPTASAWRAPPTPRR